MPRPPVDLIEYEEFSNNQFVHASACKPYGHAEWMPGARPLLSIEAQPRDTNTAIRLKGVMVCLDIQADHGGAREIVAAWFHQYREPIRKHCGEEPRPTSAANKAKRGVTLSHAGTHFRG